VIYDDDEIVKLIMLGLDGCSPDQIYRHADELPNFNRVMNAGTME
jgi:predicted AlkP superfamily phosphohydrolase/phosphomutase